MQVPFIFSLLTLCGILIPLEAASSQIHLGQCSWPVTDRHRVSGKGAESGVNEANREFLQRSIVYRPIAEFPELGRIVHLMTSDSVETLRASLANQLFSYHEPLLALRESHQQLLLAALEGSTDQELASRLGISFSAVKARWRSIFARVSEEMTALVSDREDHGGRGSEKRHLVIAYVRSHPEELRPYDWKGKHSGKCRL